MECHSVSSCGPRQRQSRAATSRIAPPVEESRALFLEKASMMGSPYPSYADGYRQNAAPSYSAASWLSFVDVKRCNESPRRASFFRLVIRSSTFHPGLPTNTNLKPVFCGMPSANNLSQML